MAKNRKIHLTGYFDSNFGDDMMMIRVVRSLPEITFAVENTVVTPLWTESNVIPLSGEECALLPKLVVIGCGFMINDTAELKTELLRLLKHYHPGDYCLGCNIEPLDTPIKRFLIGRKLNRFKLITCRDQVSYGWICRNTRRPEIHVLPDILFSLPDKWLPEKKNPDKLGISLMHRAGDSEDCTYYRSMAELADEWVQETGKGVLLLAFDTGKENDLFACHAVKALMKHADCAEVVAHRDGTEIPEAFARCEKIIGARFHAIVLALRMEIPLYPLIFREKARNLLKDIQYPFPVCDMDNLDKGALCTFLKESQPPYHLEEDVYVRANEHVRLFKQQLMR